LSVEGSPTRIEIRPATDTDLLQASAIHFDYLPGNNDDRDGTGWCPVDPIEGGPREVVLVAVEDVVIGYVWGDENVDGISVCQEVAVRAEHRDRGLGTALLRAFAREAIQRWSSRWVYLRPLEVGQLIDFYRRLGFADDPEESGYLRIEAERLARA
jgi:ribosomal protein S18 acetylase RimI-like enzyme